MKPILVTTLALLLALPGVGCSLAPTASTSPAATIPTGAQSVNVKGLDTLKFNPDTITVKAGQPVAVIFQNAGSAVHDFTLNEGVSSPVQVVETSGQTGNAVFTIDQPGTYTFFCSQPGHQQAGMVGKIVVQ